MIRGCVQQFLSIVYLSFDKISENAYILFIILYSRLNKFLIAPIQKCEQLVLLSEVINFINYCFND